MFLSQFLRLFVCLSVCLWVGLAKGYGKIFVHFLEMVGFEIREKRLDPEPCISLFNVAKLDITSIDAC